MSKVVIASTRTSIESAVALVFDRCGGLDQLLEGRKKAWIKINAVDCRPETYTSPAVLEAAIIILKKYGVADIRVVENCTQGNFTRLVFAATELGTVCRRQGVRPLFLDEGPVEELKLPGLEEKARFPRIVVKELSRNKEKPFFLNLPRLKTHSMSVVTLGVKNLFGLMDQRDRMHDHNDCLHHRLAALSVLFKPDFTIIDGIKAVYNGHYPPESLLHRCLADLNILVGGSDVIAVDTIAARILGYSMEEVKHLQIAARLSVHDREIDQIDLDGSLDRFNKKYPFAMLPEMPPDVKIIRGSEKCCPEGCRCNTEAVLQFLHLDHNGRGGFTILMGQGFDKETIEQLSGEVLLAGKCAIEETKTGLEQNRAIEKIYLSPACNDLASTIRALTRLMRVNPLKLVPLHPAHSLVLLLTAKLNGSKARVAL